MESSSRRPLNASGIPRLSRLPVPRSTVVSVVSDRHRHPEISKAAGSSTKIREAKSGGSANSGGLRTQQTKETATHRREHNEDAFEAQASVDKANAVPWGKLSLSDRTMETLSQIPPTPSPRRRRSSFFQSQTPLGSQSRPSSSLARARPSTSHGHRPAFGASHMGSRPASPEKRQLVPITGNASYYRTPRKIDAGITAANSIPRPGSRLQTLPNFSSSASDRQTKVPEGTTVAKPQTEVRPLKNESSRGAKTFAGRAVKPRVGLYGAFDSAVRDSRGLDSSKKLRDNTAGERSKHSNNPQTRKLSSLEREPDGMPKSTTASPKSSAALRATIAKAKAAHAKAMKSPQQKESIRSDGDAMWLDSDFANHDPDTLRKRTQTARNNGRLNLAAMGLSEIPREVLHMYDADQLASSGQSWYEVVELVWCNMADNEIEQLGEDFFPNVTLEEANLNNEVKASVFCGLATLDLHGNLINGLPSGFAQLQSLSVLNLSKNKLTPACFEVLCRLSGLKELRLAENDLGKGLEALFDSLQKLEVLDLRKCGIVTLPDQIRHLHALRVLSLSGNRLETTPFAELASLPLVEVDISHNHIQNTLFPRDASIMGKLKLLDASHNALLSLADDMTILLSLQSVNIAENRLEHLPEMSSCKDLITLVAPGNKITAIPEGIQTLRNLKNVDLSRNDIRKLDERVGLLDNLTVLNVTNNPLRERRFLTMNTEDLKSELRSRIAPAEDVGEPHVAAPAATDAATQPGWKVHGITAEKLAPKIDSLSHSELERLGPDGRISALILRHNDFKLIPQAVVALSETLTSFDLSDNFLSGEKYLVTKIHLPKLKKLDLSRNTIASLKTLTEFLEAPHLTELVISRNRLTNLPVLRSAFPLLTTINVSDNIIESLPAGCIQGLEYVDVTGNEITQLDPKIGMLRDHGLRTLLVGANRFRVPRRDVVDRGTSAILTWLRGRLPDEVTAL